MSRRTIVFSGALTAIAVGAVALAIAAQKKTASQSALPTAERAAASASGALPVMWQVPSFSFPDQHGRTTTTADLRGHVWIADFVFTQCTTICPLITAKMAMLQRRLEGRKTLRFVSFSVDPATDTPEVLKRYAAEWRPAEARWFLFSTTPTGLEKLASAMYVSVKPAPNDIAHSNLFFLVDATGGVRGIYESDKNDAIERLVRDTEALLEAPSAPSSAVATGRELYEALACGACHAKKELAPPLEGLVGRRVELASGGTVVADAAYVRESIALSEAKLVRGYSLRMPSYGLDLTPSELDAVVEYTVMLASAAPAPQAAAKPAEPAKLAVDPVCSMDVRVVETTPRASHAGRTTYFCSEMCRERFVAEPTRYAKTANDTR